MAFNREVMTFYVPTKREHLNSDEALDRSVVPMYISPSTVSIRDAKRISDTMTKGGYIVQYWGEALTSINVGGTTGSGGIEAITILRDVYRNEHLQMKEDITARIRESQNKIVSAWENEDDPSNISQFGGILNDLSGGISGNWIEGTKSFINNVVDSFDQLVDENTKSIILAPTLASYAVSVDMYHQGEKFRGYFKGFSVTERGQSPGLFDYSFDFIVLKRSGKRVNFMPWHRNPRDASGAPRKSTIPSDKEFRGTDKGLTYAPAYSEGARFQSGESVSEAATSDGDTADDTGDAAEESWDSRRDQMGGE
jgi:hypothetical protein